MINTLTTQKSSVTHYQTNNLSGLSEQEIFGKGLHGLVVHIHRATVIPVEDPHFRTIKNQHLCRADMLLNFLISLADSNSEMGRNLVHCYTGIQLLIGHAIMSDPPDDGTALHDALAQARALESEIKDTLRELSHG